MGVRDEVVDKVASGMSPVDIARERGVSLNTILGYIDQMITDGRIKRSDVLLTVPEGVRRPLLDALQDGRSQKPSAVLKRVRTRGADASREYVEVVMRYGSRRHALGEIYEGVRTIEVELHSQIRQALERQFGQGEAGWWKEGIPAKVRVECQERREYDADYSSEPYGYTTITHLKQIVEKKGNWGYVCKQLRLREGDKQKLCGNLDRLNQIRNLVMHPVRGGRPSESDFEFIRDLLQWLGFTRRH